MTDVEAVISAFVAYLKANSYSMKTITDHCYAVRGLVDLHAAIPVSPHAIRLFLGNTRWADATRLIRWKNLKAFYDFLLHDGYITDSPFALIPRPRAGKARRPPRYTDADLKAMLAVCHLWSWVGKRDQALLWLLWTTPARISEICKLKGEDISDRRLILHGKGGKQYASVLWPECAEAIGQYLTVRPNGSPYLLVNLWGGQMTADAARRALYRMARAAGMKKKIYPHAFRHNFGMRTVEWGLSLDVAKHVMGHSSTKSTEIYRQWVTEDNALEEMDRIARKGVA